jgi:hypothetical protein
MKLNDLNMRMDMVRSQVSSLLALSVAYKGDKEGDKAVSELIEALAELGSAISMINLNDEIKEEDKQRAVNDINGYIVLLKAAYPKSIKKDHSMIRYIALGVLIVAMMVMGYVK